MRIFNYSLKTDYPTQGGELECMLMEMPWDSGHENWRRPAVIVVPGGAYAMVSKREGGPVAAEFFAKGYQTFVLTYLCQPDGICYPEQLIELASAVDYVKKHAEEFNVNPEEVFVVGFSAGGHLVGNLAVEYNTVSQKAGVELDCKPTAVGLSYPVISQKTAYKGTHENLLYGYTEEAKAELLKTLNLDEAVSEATAPCFIWATAEDNLVPAENSLMFALALAKQKIAYEIHVYQKGWHGLSTGSCEINDGGKSEMLTRVSAWVGDCVTFFRGFCKEEF